MTILLILFSFLCLIAVYTRHKRAALKRFLALDYNDAVKEEIDWSLARNHLKSFGDRFGKAGFYSEGARRIVKLIVAAFFIVVFILCLIGIGSILISLFAAIYLTALTTLMFLKFRAKDLERETLFRLPLFLESVILLVESGLGVLPAVQSVVESGKRKNEPVTQVMQAVYQLSSSGLPFGQSLELVAAAIDSKPLRHVLLHLDLSSSEGGALVPSLRSLAEYAHREWKLSVEARVKGLENAVVFPVFAAVIGLMLLVVAVPIVPVVDFFSGLDKQKLESVSKKVNTFSGSELGATK